MSRHVIVAESFRHARNSAEIDWHWERIGLDHWRTPDNHEVRYLSSTWHLQGLRRGDVVVHLGYAWYRNPELRDLSELCAARNFKMVEH